MSIKKVLAEATKMATPSPEEQSAIELATDIVLNRLNTALKRKRVKAKALCGGSFAKGTWLPSHTDIDCFVEFKYRTHKDRSAELADLLEPAIKIAFTHYVRIHGSRDYFQANYDDYVFEFVPVLKVKKPSKVKNITDMSPLHVDWIKKRAKKTRLKNHIRLAKLFFKATGVYGAESYIKGFSGHVAEILVAHYGSFGKLARATQRWTPKVFVDPEHHYRGKRKAMERINKAKLDSPLLVIDPTQPERNAAAALSNEKFNKLKSTFRRFLTSPRIAFFKEHTITVGELKKRARNRNLIILKGEPQYNKRDISGAKLLKQFEHLITQLRINDLRPLEKGWQWMGVDEDALFWFYFDKALLPPTKKHYGPTLSSAKSRIDGFLAKYGLNARRDAKRLYVTLKRKHRKPETLLKSLLKMGEFSNIQFVK